MPTFPKTEKLCKRDFIQTLFQQANSFSCYPLKLLYVPIQAMPVPYQLLVSVPKRHFKRAVDRNCLKRRLRESYRLQKHLLPKNMPKGYALALIYIGKEKISYAKISHCAQWLFTQFANAMRKIVVFASGSGSNAERIATYFQEKRTAQVSLILSNNPQAGVLARAKRLAIPTVVFDRQAFYHSSVVLDLLKAQQPDLIVLAGFLWKVPEALTEAYPNQIVNIHPSLLPKYGGKGMYGAHVHTAVIEHAETESGITIHYVNEHYDEGNIIFQAKTDVLPTDTPDTLAEKIHLLEYEHFPKIIEQLINQTTS